MGQVGCVAARREEVPVTVNKTDRMCRAPRHFDAARAILEPAMSGGGGPRAIGGFLSRGVEVFSVAVMISQENRCDGRAAKKFTLDPSRVPDESEAFMLAWILWCSSTARGTTVPQNSTATREDLALDRRVPPAGAVGYLAADTAFHGDLALHLARRDRIRTVDATLYSAEFGAACVEAFNEIWQESGAMKADPGAAPFGAGAAGAAVSAAPEVATGLMAMDA
jgi:hypothetical protein